MSSFYITSDTIGTETGGGQVTLYESRALGSLGPYEIWSRETLGKDGPEPWGHDEWLSVDALLNSKVKLTHLYAGTFGKTVAKLKANDCKVCYTIAAHDRFVSRQEHEKLGIPFTEYYPHLVRSDLWQRYIEGYHLADVIVCPSAHAANAVRAYGDEFATKRIEIIPHGVELPPSEKVKPLPKDFVVGYLGSFGVDKGVIYLLQAWKKLNLKDGLLLLAGRDSNSDWVHKLIDHYGGGNVMTLGWVKDKADFYNRISCYCQPSVTEGFGCEVSEAGVYSRAVVCSDGAGASDLALEALNPLTRACCDDDIVWALDHLYRHPELRVEHGARMREAVEDLTWVKIQERYIKLWKELLYGKPSG